MSFCNLNSILVGNDVIVACHGNFSLFSALIMASISGPGQVGEQASFCPCEGGRIMMKQVMTS
jgi:hypothetical protein